MNEKPKKYLNAKQVSLEPLLRLSSFLTKHRTSCVLTHTRSHKFSQNSKGFKMVMKAVEIVGH